MDSELIEQLLFESESEYLDFKQEQYKFNKADENTKSEILKDILAFSNSWRRTDAYIIIGVKEVKGGKGEVIGISEHLDDNSLQEFVNSKTQVPVSFSYIAQSYEDKQIGIILIPVQKRPIYIKNKYGKVEGNTVYLRRGSATFIAKPDEIAKMGINIKKESDQPSLELQIVHKYSRELFGQEVTLISTLIKLPTRDNIPDFEPDYSLLSYTPLSSPRRNFYRKLVAYFDNSLMVNPVCLVLKNTGPILAKNVRLEILHDLNSNICLLKEDELESFPEKFSDYLLDSPTDKVNLDLNPSISIQKFKNEIELKVAFGSIQPGSSSWMEENLYIGSRETETIILNCKVFADNLEAPIIIPLKFNFEINSIESDLPDLEKKYEEIISNPDFDFFK